MNRKSMLIWILVIVSLLIVGCSQNKEISKNDKIVMNSDKKMNMEYKALSDENPEIAVLKENYQEIRMNVTAKGWTPDRFIIKKGVPVHWVVNGVEITNCNKAIQVPEYNLKFDIIPGEKTIVFTPNKTGDILWSCWMDMIPGKFVVMDEIENITLPTNTVNTTKKMMIIKNLSNEKPSVATLKGDYQEIRMNVTAKGWSPDKFILQEGVKVKWVIDGKNVTRCLNAIIVPAYSLNFSVKQGEQTIEFFPNGTGITDWSCWMKNDPGRFTIVDNLSKFIDTN